MSQQQWARLIAHAWKNPNVLKALRKDPEKEIARLKKIESTDPDYFGDISDLGTSNAGGFFPLPEVPEGLENLDEAQLVKFLRDNGGIFGIMQWCCL